MAGCHPSPVIAVRSDSAEKIDEELIRSSKNPTRRFIQKSFRSIIKSFSIQLKKSAPPPKPQKCEPQTFHRFTELPDELQLKIFSFAFSGPRLRVIWPLKLPNVTPKIGLRALMEPSFHVNYKFREATLKDRRLAFALYYCGTPVCPPQIPFDFHKDCLVIPQDLLNVHRAFEIPDLQRVKYLVIAWDRMGLGTAAIERLARWDSKVDAIFLIHKAFVARSVNNTHKASTYELRGPHWRGQRIAVKIVEEQLQDHYVWNDRNPADIPLVRSLRTTNHSDMQDGRQRRLHEFARMSKEEITVMAWNCSRKLKE